MPSSPHNAMPFFETPDPAFDRFVLHHAPVRQRATRVDWVEGPVRFGDAGCLPFTDAPNDRILRWTPGSGITPTATAGTGWGGWYRANTSPGARRARNMRDPSR